MANLDIIRAWKDEEYRESLTAEQRKLLPEHPAGLIELDDADLDPVAGGMMTATIPPITYAKTCTNCWQCF